MPAALDTGVAPLGEKASLDKTYVSSELPHIEYHQFVYPTA
jgi:hypothetical protein